MSRVGKLLIAHPNLHETNWFRKTVTYIYSDCPKLGTLGLVLNLVTPLSVADMCAARDIFYPYDQQFLYNGGPAGDYGVIMLHTDDWQSSNTASAGKGYRISSDYDMFEKIANGDEPAYFRIFSGVSAWAPGQLDIELAGKPPYKPENSWLLADSNDDIMFNKTGIGQWEKTLYLSSAQMFDSYL